MQRLNDLLVGSRIKSIGIDSDDIHVFLTSVYACSIGGLSHFSTIETAISNMMVHRIF